MRRAIKVIKEKKIFWEEDHICFYAKNWFSSEKSHLGSILSLLEQIHVTCYCSITTQRTCYSGSNAWLQSVRGETKYSLNGFFRNCVWKAKIKNNFIIIFVCNRGDTESQCNGLQTRKLGEWKEEHSYFQLILNSTRFLTLVHDSDESKLEFGNKSRAELFLRAEPVISKIQASYKLKFFREGNICYTHAKMI